MAANKVKSGKASAINSIIAGGLLLLANSFPIAAYSVDGKSKVESAAAKAAAKEGGNYALLIAIDKYISPDINELNGCNKDIQDVQKMLEKNGFPNDTQHIKILTDKNATKQAIIEAFRTQLIDNAIKHPDAFFYFQYSGHGSRMRDPIGGDEDGYDETIVPADSRTEGHYDMLDKEIAPLIAELTSHTKNAILTFDSCHSGNINRDPKGARALKEDKRPMPDSMKSKSTTRSTESSGSFVPRKDSYVCFSACLPTQTAQETEDPDPTQRNGLMTRHLLESLAEATPSTTYRQLLQMLREKMPSDQLPQFDGDLDRVIFGTTSDRSDASLRVSSINGKILTVDGGSNLGITEGSVVAFYKHDTLKLQGEKDLLGKGLVTKVNPLSCEVTLPESVKLSEADAKGAKAIIASTKIAADPQRILIQVPKDPALNTEAAQKILTNLERLAQKDQTLKIVGKVDNPFPRRSSDYDVVVANDRFDVFNSTNKKLSDAPPAETPVYFITTPSGAPLFNFFVKQSDPLAAMKIQKAISKKSQQDFIRKLGNRLSPLDSKLEVTVIRISGHSNDAKKTPIEAPVRREDQLGPPVFHVDDEFELAIKNTSNIPLFINVLAMGSSGAIETVYSTESKALAPGDTMKTDPLIADYPLGSEALKIIATTKPANFSVLSQTSVERGEQPNNSAAETGVQGIVSRGVRDVHKSARQDVDAVSLDDWTATLLDYIIKDKSTVASMPKE